MTILNPNAATSTNTAADPIQLVAEDCSPCPPHVIVAPDRLDSGRPARLAAVANRATAGESIILAVEERIDSKHEKATHVWDLDYDDAYSWALAILNAASDARARRAATQATTEVAVRLHADGRSDEGAAERE